MIGQVRSVVGSVYIAPGQIKQLDVFREQLGKICRDFPRVIVGMDANVRHPLWYDNIVTHRSVNKKMGERLAKIFDRLLVGGFWTTTSSQTTLQSNSPLARFTTLNESSVEIGRIWIGTPTLTRVGYHFSVLSEIGMRTRLMLQLWPSKWLV